MFVGHAAVAFALVGLGAAALGWSRDQALALGVIAAIGATLPDLDILTALPSLVAGAGLVPVEAFWEGATAHRSLTHSMVVAGPIAAIIGLIAASGWRRVAGLGLAVVTGSLLVALPEGHVSVVAPFVLGAVGLGLLGRRLPVGWQTAALAAGIGLVTHPFGDLVTGDPPWVLYPTGMEVFTGRVTLAPDPTLHLLAAFFLEIAAIWVGFVAISRLRDTSLRERLEPRAALGALFAGTVFLIPAPTLAESYQFVFGVLTMGTVGVVPRDRQRPLAWAVTGLAAITVGGIAYTIVYLFVVR